MRLSVLIMALFMGLGLLPFTVSGASASCAVVQAYDPCEPPVAREALHRRAVHHHFHAAVPQLFRSTVHSNVSEYCSVMVEDRTPQGRWYDFVNHAQIRVEGGPHDGWSSVRLSLRKGTNQIVIPCGKARGASRLAVWVFGNEAKCRYLTGYDVAAGLLNPGDPIWIERN